MWCRLQYIYRNALGNAPDHCMDRAQRQIGVACHRLDIAVPEHFADERQGLAERQRMGREGRTEIERILNAGLTASPVTAAMSLTPRSA